MESTFSKIIALILATLLLFIFPVLNMFIKQDDTTHIFVFTETSKFVDQVRNLGYITPMMYREFANKLSATNNTYSIEMEHYHKKYDPIYDDPANAATFKDDFNVNFKATYTDNIMSTLFPNPPLTGEKYKLSKGDYFAVRVKNKNKTLATKLQEMLYNANLSEAKIIVRYGGMIKDEAY
ncbi:MAG: hypothetical protein N3B21_00330 [Clostridia bacterium]|nr:hypothetical protein [Clostridia bacterium]